MQKITAQDPESRSADIVTGNIEQLKALFPEAFAEGKIDFEVLKQLLGGAVEEREEKYGLNWHGKRQARQLALTPSTGTLRPCPEESVDWDTTKNLMIEGDNLEVLKLLQKSYAGKVKLIYIDPPYNTGKDFVYPDDFRDNIKNYLELTGQVEGGRKISSNTEASGRFHTDWINMMYPRLKLARNLLTAEGSVWVSIDDNELQNLKALCDAVFGEENFVGIFIWEKRTTRENRKVFSINHDYIACYAREKSVFEVIRCLLPRSDESEGRFANPDNDQRGVWQSVSLNAQAGPGRRKDQFYSITTPSGRIVNPPSGRCWVYTEDRFKELLEDNRIWFGEEGNNVPRLKCFRSEANDGLVPHTLWRADEVGTTDTAKKAIKDLFDGVEVFDTPKPIALLRRIIQIGTEPKQADIVCDFFAGAAPVGEAIYEQNAEDAGRRRFVVVQLPEPLPADSPARGLNHETLSEVAKERLRRAGKKIQDEAARGLGDKGTAGRGDLAKSAPTLFPESPGHPVVPLSSHPALDRGFRVFKLDSSNIRAWDPDRDNLSQTLLDHLEHLKPGRSEADILYELLLKLGLDLCVPIEKRSIAGKEVHAIGGGVLIACLATRISREEVEPLALGIVEWHKALGPAGDTTCVFRDSAFSDDVAKTNLAAILAQNGITTVRSL